MRVRAWAHLHTLVSGDSDLEIEVLKHRAAAEGIRVLFLTEHREAMDDDEVAAAAARCRELSDDEVLLVPGLEISSDERYHVLAFGLVKPVPKGPAVEMAAGIREAGAVPVLAHPVRYRPGWEDTLAGIGGIEVWNRHYDGRVAPPPAFLAAWRNADGVHAFFGLDAHGEEALAGSLPELVLDLPEVDEVGEVDESAAVAALSEGRFSYAVGGGAVDLGNSGTIRSLMGRGYRGLRRVARRLSYLLPLKAETRKKLGRRW